MPRALAGARKCSAGKRLCREVRAARGWRELTPLQGSKIGKHRPSEGTRVLGGIGEAEVGRDQDGEARGGHRAACGHRAMCWSSPDAHDCLWLITDQLAPFAARPMKSSWTPPTRPSPARPSAGLAGLVSASDTEEEWRGRTPARLAPLFE